jgi:ankyrin repeat protein
MHYTKGQGSVRVIRQLVEEYNVPVDSRGENSMTPLQLASRHGKLHFKELFWAQTSL